MARAKAPPKADRDPAAGGARGAALALLGEVAEGRMLRDVAPARLEALPPPERARALRLATETLRWADRADRMLGPFLRLKPTPDVHALLRLGTVEMHQLGGAPHGVVNAAVNLAPARARGLVNAVLRRVARAGGWQELPLPRLPKPLRKRLVAAWGKARTEAIEAAHAAGAPLDLTPRDGDAAALAAELGGEALPTGSVRLAAGGQVSALPGYAEGRWWVQDAAAALPVRALRPAAGEAIADLCAAPGGKTLQLAAAGAKVTAVDADADRLERVAENLARTGLRAELVHGDARALQGRFDAVLLDAPCSATGTIRRHPDLPHVRPDPDLAPLLALQAELLDAAARLLRPGGRLVYATCSLLPEEGEAQLAAALVRHPDLRADPMTLPGAEPGWRAGPGAFRLTPDAWPERGGLDGFFIAALRREG